MRTIAVLLVAASVSAFAVTITDTPTSADDLFPANYRALITARKGDIFKDPDSVRDASISAPKRGSGPYLSPQGFITPWISCVRANAKNSFGGISGNQLTAVIISHNAFVEAKAVPANMVTLAQCGVQIMKTMSHSPKSKAQSPALDRRPAHIRLATTARP